MLYCMGAPILPNSACRLCLDRCPSTYLICQNAAMTTTDYGPIPHPIAGAGLTGFREVGSNVPTTAPAEADRWISALSQLERKSLGGLANRRDHDLAIGAASAQLDLLALELGLLELLHEGRNGAWITGGNHQPPLVA
jgi:hypothetical protein